MVNTSTASVIFIEENMWFKHLVCKNSSYTPRKGTSIWEIQIYCHEFFVCLIEALKLVCNPNSSIKWLAGRRHKNLLLPPSNTQRSFLLHNLRHNSGIISGINSGSTNTWAMVVLFFFNFMKKYLVTI